MNTEQPEQPNTEQPNSQQPIAEQPGTDQIATRKLVQLPKRKRGPKPLAFDLVRLHTVSVRLNPAELNELDKVRKLVQMQRGQYLRSAAIGVLPPTIPAINREAWANLARVSGNLNQFQQSINNGTASGYPLDFLENLRDLVGLLRAELLGIDTTSEEIEVHDES